MYIAQYGKNLKMVPTHTPEHEKVITKNHMKILWDFNIHTDKVIHHRIPDIVAVNSADKTVEIIDVAIPSDKRVQEKKIDHYTDLKIELQRIWHSKISITAVVIGALRP